MGRSLSCSPEGIQKAKKALIRFSLTQKALAEELKVTRQPIGKFLTGKPVDRNLFVQICEFLELDWEEVITQVNEPETETNPENRIEINTLVQEVREKIKPLIQERCGTMRVLDMTHPIGLNDIYTNVNILETITGRQRRGIDELLQQCNQEDFYRFGMGRVEKRVPGLDAVQKYPKLMILGKPGAGKTTFLKYLAIQCIEDVFYSHLVPVFITLKDFAEAINQPTLQEYFYYLFTTWGVSNGQVNDLFKHGRAFVLFDGLDEVREEDSSRVINSIRNFSEELFFSQQFKQDSIKYLRQIEIDFQKKQEKYGSKNKATKATNDYIFTWLCENFPKKCYVNNFIATCRIAAKEYTFEKFTEVEVADFDEEQIATFATKWFKNKPVKPENFIKHIEDNKPIQELASSPLLLTLLCLAFEESGEFPANRSELYKEGLDALLKKWDAKRGIQREQIYKKLSVQRKEDLLSKIALTTFERSDYFFKQKAAEKYIIKYICNLSDVNNDPEELQLDSEKILKSIEAQHGLLVERAKGIYSFSHLTFHEYFTAREFVLVQQSSNDALQSLVSHFTENRWREVCLLAVGMSPNADRLLLLIKKTIDVLVSQDKRLQQFLEWLKEKSISINLNYKLSAIKFIYLGIVLWFDGKNKNHYFELKNHYFEIANKIDSNIQSGYNEDYAYLCLVYDRCIILDIILALDLTIARDYNSETEEELQRIEAKLPNLDSLNEDKESMAIWWQYNGQDWIEQLRTFMIKYRNIGHDWQFSEEQEELLKQYIDANEFLLECLNSDCYVSRDVRQYIENTLLLPITDIETIKLSGSYSLKN
jgi:predicted NACHT family NTPase